MRTIDVELKPLPVLPTDEHVEQENAKLIADLATYRTRAFLNAFEKNQMLEYYNKPARNRIIALFNFDKSGNFLPELYHADKNIVNMLYPLQEVIDFERQGTIIIDREQWHPNLKNLSFFIYMVDEELYDLYRTSQNFLGESAPTYMFDRNFPNGCRIFKDYHALARHLRNQRIITYCLGPRTAFYMRYYLHAIHIHTTNDEWGYGKKIADNTAIKVTDAVKRHLAFNTVSRDKLEIKFTEDKQSQYRSLAKFFKINLTDIIKKENTIMIERYCKQTMHSKNVCRIKNNKQEAYQALGIMPYHHLLIIDGHVIAFIWDSRDIQAVVPVSEINENDITYNVIDMKTDLKLTESASDDIKAFIEAHKYDIPVQFKY